MCFSIIDPYPTRHGCISMRGGWDTLWCVVGDRGGNPIYRGVHSGDVGVGGGKTDRAEVEIATTPFR